MTPESTYTIDHAKTILARMDAKQIDVSKDTSGLSNNLEGTFRVKVRGTGLDYAVLSEYLQLKKIQPPSEDKKPSHMFHGGEGFMYALKAKTEPKFSTAVDFYVNGTPAQLYDFLTAVENYKDAKAKQADAALTTIYQQKSIRKKVTSNKSGRIPTDGTQPRPERRSDHHTEGKPTGGFGWKKDSTKPK